MMTRWDVVVDTHSTPALASQLLDQAAVRPSEGLLRRHDADYDHAWGNQVFAAPGSPFQTPIIGHELCAERLAGEDGAGSLATKRAEEPGRFDAELDSTGISSLATQG